MRLVSSTSGVPRPASRRTANAGRRPCAFTLIELMVVIAIIGLVLVVTVPALGPMMASSEMAQMVNTMNGLLTSAQTLAQANGTPVLIRIERAYATRKILIAGQEYEAMDLDANGEARWLDHQQARFLIANSSKNQDVRELPDSKVVALPRSIWLAPDYGVNVKAWREWNFVNYPANFAEQFLKFTPSAATYPGCSPFNRLDTFYIAFNQFGELTRKPAAEFVFLDRMQVYDKSGKPIAPYVPHPDDSARGLLAYDRTKYNAISPQDGPLRESFLEREGRPVYINRALGGIVEEKPQ